MIVTQSPRSMSVSTRYGQIGQFVIVILKQCFRCEILKQAQIIAQKLKGQ